MFRGTHGVDDGSRVLVKGVVLSKIIAMDLCMSEKTSLVSLKNATLDQTFTTLLCYAYTQNAKYRCMISNQTLLLW